MRNLIVCCDGTWNSRENMDEGRPAPTNVVRIHAEVEPDHSKTTIPQIRYYRSGVGTSGNFLKRLKDGALGTGLDDDIRSAYKWLAETLQPNDRVFLFGFSRGAYTVRSLAGLIGSIGLVDVSGADVKDPEKWELTYFALEAYRNRKRRLAGQAQKLLDRRTEEKFAKRLHKDYDGTIHFLGVWDTVGALGIPGDLEVLKNLSKDPYKYNFHDTNLGDKVTHARHAVAMDELRHDFTPTLWTNLDERPDGTTGGQMWFAGVHGDVGGSYFHRGLGDVTLEWMMSEAQGQGMELRTDAIAMLDADPRGILHNSFSGIFSRRPSRPRSAPNLEDPNNHNTVVSPRLLDRYRRPAPAEDHYWRTVDLDVGDSHMCWISARVKWSRTAIYLRGDAEYSFEATGEWLDASLKANGDGLLPGFNVKKGIYYVAQAPFIRYKWNRRFTGAPWFSLVGVVTNGEGADEATKQPADHEYFKIGQAQDGFQPKNGGGYLYAFANDAWSRYGNNKGTLKLKVTRTK